MVCVSAVSASKSISVFVQYNSKSCFVNGNHVVMKTSKYAIFSKYFAINLFINHNYNITVMIKIFYYQIIEIKL